MSRAAIAVVAAVLATGCGSSDAADKDEKEKVKAAFQKELEAKLPEGFKDVQVDSFDPVGRTVVYEMKGSRGEYWNVGPGAGDFDMSVLVHVNNRPYRVFYAKGKHHETRTDQLAPADSKWVRETADKVAAATHSLLNR